MRFTRNTILVILAMVGIFFVLSIIPNYIPESKLKDNITKSIQTLKKDDSKAPIGNIIFFKLDNFTDALMMNIAYNINSEHPLKSAMENTYCIGDDNEIIWATEKILHGDYTDITPINYTRYWHGYLLFLRPMLLIFDYDNIRIINYICFSILFLSLCCLVLKICGKAMLTVFCISTIIFNLWIVPLSMQFSTVFYIAFIASIILLWQMKAGRKEHNRLIPYFFMAIGGATSFFDFLTAPLITLGLPLSIYSYMSTKNIKEKYIQVFSYSLTWLLGYATIWISKWIIAHFIIGYDINDAISSILFRTSTEYNDFDMSFYGIFQFLTNHAPMALAMATLQVTVFIILNIFLYYKKKDIFIGNSQLLLIASMPFIWCITLRNHSIIHFSFVWRVFFISIISYLMFIAKLYIPSNQQLKKGSR